MIVVKHKKRIKMLYRIIYIFCFFSLSLIDWSVGSMEGRIQFVTINCTGIIVAIIILTGYSIKEFFRPIFIIWTGGVLLGAPIAIYFGIKLYPYKGQWITAVVNVCIYGYIIIRVVLKYLVEKKRSIIRWKIFAAFAVMIFLMMLSPNESLWPFWFGGIFGSFYLTEYDNGKNIQIYKGLVDGIVLAFFVIQGLALFFRPYDIVRYRGLYLNPNMNALFYVTSFCAFLCKCYILQKETKRMFIKILMVLMSGAMYGFCILTGSRTSIIALTSVLIVFAICVANDNKKKALTLIRTMSLVLVIGALSVPITYLAVRYVPTVHLHPIYFMDEYNNWSRINSGDPRDSDKYVSFDEMITNNISGKYKDLFDHNSKGGLDFLFPARRVYATESEVQEEQYLVTSDNSSGINIRFQIYKWYFSKLNIFGHSNGDHGAPVSAGYTAPHAHNWWLQMTFNYGIPVGILLIAAVILYINRIFIILKYRDTIRACLVACFLTAFLVFGSFEMDFSLGQLPFTLFFFLFREVIVRREPVTQKIE